MVKTDLSGLNQEKTMPKADKSPKVKVSKTKFFLGAAVIAAVAFAATNPQAVKQAYVYLENLHNAGAGQAEAPDPITILNQQVSELQRQLADLQYQLDNQAPTAAQVMIDDENLADMKERIAAIEKQNLNVIDSKADVAVVLGLLTRLDSAEARINKLAKISDDGALILSATMMVKEAAESGRPYPYEAEVLELLAQGDEKLIAPVSAVVKHAESGVAGKAALISEFDRIYNRLLEAQKAEFAKTWKDRLNSKLNEIIKVKRVDKERPEFEKDKTLERIKMLVGRGDFAKAAAVIDDPQNHTLLTDEALKEWAAKAGARVEFEKAVSKISAHSLALMKVNYIKQESNND